MTGAFVHGFCPATSWGCFDYLSVLLNPMIPDYKELSTYDDGCGLKRIGFSSTNKMPVRISAAPRAARRERTSPAKMKAVTQENIGSRARIKAVRVGVVCCCAQVCTEKPSAIASRLVTPRATITAGLQRMCGASTHQHAAMLSSATVAT